MHWPQRCNGKRAAAHLRGGDRSPLKTATPCRPPVDPLHARSAFAGARGEPEDPDAARPPPDPL
eukprot:1099106-Prorocentrum_minimum.AAC.1